MQYWHICCLSMDCINSYEPSNLQDLRHWSHVCGFSFKWLCWWSFRWCVRVAECTHYVHLIGFSLMWVLRCDGWWNDLKQWSHLCGFLPLCVTRWTLRILAPVAERSHIDCALIPPPVYEVMLRNTYLTKCFIALLTSMWLFKRMSKQVHLERTLLTKWFNAFITLKDSNSARHILLYWLWRLS